MSTLLPTPTEIRDLFNSEISDLGGTVTDVYVDDERLFMRALLGPSDDVRHGDQMQGGVALRSRGHSVEVHPYIFRQICRNGLVRAEMGETHVVQRVGLDASNDILDETLSDLQQAIRDRSDARVFRRGLRGLRRAADTEMATVLELLPLLSRCAGKNAANLVRLILGQFESEGDETVYGLVNAVTAVARDQPDPEIRWQLEELGGGVPALVAPAKTPGGAAADLVPS